MEKQRWLTGASQSSFNYWKGKGWLESDYYYPVKLRFHFWETISEFQIHEKEGKY